MVKKKSVLSKAKTRRKSYLQLKAGKNSKRLWGVLLCTMKAVRIFLRSRHNGSLCNIGRSNDDTVERNQIFRNYVDVINNDKSIPSVNKISKEDETENLKIVEKILKRIVSKVSRLDSERKRQSKLRKRNKLLRVSENNKRTIKRNIFKKYWFMKKYRNNISFRNKKRECLKQYFHHKYNNNTRFHNEHQVHMNMNALKKYHNNADFRGKHRLRMKTYFSNRNRNNKEFREKHRLRMKTYFSNRNRNNKEFREKHRLRMKTYFSNRNGNNKEFSETHRLRMKMYILNKYSSNRKFREKHRLRMKMYNLNKHQNDNKFHEKHRLHMKMYILNKYYNNHIFHEKHKTYMKKYVSQTYYCNNQKRFKKTQDALTHYYSNYSSNQRNLRQIYNKKRRSVKKNLILYSQTCAIKHREIYMNCLKSFRKLAKEGPDYICIVCGLALFRSQVVPYVEHKYIKNSMSHKTKQKINSCISNKLLYKRNWICRWCSDKLKKQEIPNRALINNLDVSEIPIELKKLNNLEQHLIALRLPFIKIVNLTSGKISNRFAQKGTVGPLHCVPSDVQDTVTSLPRPIDKSMMIRLQLKRRINYKAVWEEQLINPNDVRNALLFLIEHHPGYKDIETVEITEDYIVSDKVNNITLENERLLEEVDPAQDKINDAFENIEQNDEEHMKRLALGDVNNNVATDDGDEIFEDYDDSRTKYNSGTDCCIQPSDLNDYTSFANDPCIVAPAEKNQLSSLLTDNSIEKLAFPHLFPDGAGTYEEERQIKLNWKDYCKARLFSSDNRFASDSSYIFFLQYLSDLRQAFSGINIAFRKKIPITAKQSLDNNQMKFLMNNDMIYRYLQSVRGSPQYWNQRLKELFGMNRQIGCPTFFLTLTSGDLRWKEFVDVFIRHTGERIKDSYSFEEKTKMLRSNPVLAARMFERRLNTFMNLFVKGNASCLGRVEDWFYRIEMQMRGSPHSHTPLWVKDAPKYNGIDTDEKTREDIIIFCDKYITTYFPDRSEDPELHDIIKEVQMHSRNHSKSCLIFYNTICRFGFPRPVSRRTFLCEPLKIETEEDKKLVKKAKAILIEMNAAMNELEKDHELSWSDFDTLLEKYNWTYDDYEWSLKAIQNRPIIIHKRDPNARWVNQYNKEILKAWNANMDIQFILNPYACAKYLMSYTTKPEREMSLLLEETHKECREGNLSAREEMKKLTGTFFNHRQVSVQEAVYRAAKMPLTYSSRGFVFVPSHSNSCRFLKSPSVLEKMQPDDENIYMSNLADKYFDRPLDDTFDICMADFASKYDIVSVKKTIKNPKTPIKQLQTLKFGVKKRCGRDAIIRYPYFNREIDTENYYENLLSLYLPIRKREEIKKPYELFYEKGEVFDVRQQCLRKVKEIVNENRKKYEAHYASSEEVESIFNDLSTDKKVDEWAEIVAQKEKNRLWSESIEQEENPDFDMFGKKKEKSTIVDLKQTYTTTNDMKPLLESMNVEQQEIFYYVRDWCFRRLQDRDIEPLRLFITGGAGTGKSHILKCLHYEATRIFSQKKYLEPDENINEIHTLITAFTGAAAVNVGGVTIHSAFGISSNRDHLYDNLSCSKLNSYRCKLGSLKLLFVDEVSLIQASLWGAMHSRLTQIMGLNSNSALFGNVSIIALGDFYQCSPVASSGIYSTLLWSDHFEYVELKINERQKNTSFSKMLNRIRALKKKQDMLEEDQSTLKKCQQRFLNKEYHPESLHVFAKNAQVDAHNEQMLDNICTNIRTFYETHSNGKEIKANESKQRKMAHKPLRLAINARVMITKNICVTDGLANGVMGHIVGYIENINNEVSHILIRCDSKSTGRLHRSICSYCQGKDTICVTRESDVIERDNSDFPCRSATKQFPLRLSWAITVHKAQGLTVDELVVNTKDLFGSGMGYTALSRTRTLEGLFLSDLYLKKFYCDENIDKILSKMKSMKKTTTIFEENPHVLNILFHNIEGLNSNFIALRNYYLTKKADLICLAETCLTDKHNINQYQIDDYNFLHRTRSSLFKSNHPLHFQKGGGVGIYYRQNVQIKEINSSSIFNFEHITVEHEKQNIIILTCYRSPQLDKASFLKNLESYLKNIDKQKRILIIGDFNEDSFKTNSKTIESYMHTLGFSNLFKNMSTTNSFTSIDCVYSNFLSEKDTLKEVKGTFYSFHEALIFSIHIEPDNIELSNAIDQNCNNEMEVDVTEQVSFPVFKEVSTTRKRKENSSVINIEKKKKRFTNSSIKCKTNSISIEKQRFFLQNINKLIKENNLTSENSTTTLKEQLLLLNLKNVDVLGDGNCFFRAISHQLYRSESNHMNIRSMAIFYIETHHDIYMDLIENIDSSIENYINRMRKNRTYADSVSILATAVTINRNIIVHERFYKPILIPGSDYIDQQVHVSYNPDTLHYNSVTCIDDTQPFLAFQDLQLV